MIGFHANYLADDWTIRAEWVQADVDQEAGVLVPDAPMLNMSTGDYGMEAWYLEGSYVVHRIDDERWLRAILRFDAVDTNDEAMFTPFDRSRTTVGLEYQFSSNARIRAEYQQHKINDFENAPMPFVAAGGEEDIDMLMVSLIFWF